MIDVKEREAIVDLLIDLQNKHCQTDDQQDPANGSFFLSSMPKAKANAPSHNQHDPQQMKPAKQPRRFHFQIQKP